MQLLALFLLLCESCKLQACSLDDYVINATVGHGGGAIAHRSAGRLIVVSARHLSLSRLSSFGPQAAPKSPDTVIRYSRVMGAPREQRRRAKA